MVLIHIACVHVCRLLKRAIVSVRARVRLGGAMCPFGLLISLNVCPLLPAAAVWWPEGKRPDAASTRAPAGG